MTLRRRLALLALLFPLLAAACGGSSAKPLSDATLRGLVLQPSDLGANWTQFDVGRQGRSDFHPGPRGSATRFGRQSGWKARYRREGVDASTRGPLVLDSRVDSFDRDGGARDDLDAYVDEWRDTARSAGAKEVAYTKPDGLGDAARTVDLLQGTRANGQRLIVVAWRRGRVTASVSGTGIAGRVSVGDVLRLARRQDAHLSRALS